MTTSAKLLRSHTSNVLKQVVTDIRFLNVYVTMNKNEQQMYQDISAIAKALTKIVKIIEKEMKR